jgi:hypothetical protein
MREGASMSALGHKRTCRLEIAMSALPPIADIGHRECDVRFVPKADSCTAAKRDYSITSSASASILSGTVMHRNKRLFDQLLGKGQQ